MTHRWTLVLLVVVACGPGTNDSNGTTADSMADSTGDSTADSTSDDPTSSTTGSSTGDGPTSTTADATGSGTDTGEPMPTTGEPSTGDDTGVTPGGGCQAYCDNAEMCSGDPDPGCLDGCLGTVSVFEYIGPACVAAFDVANHCTGALSCEELAEVGESADYPCLAEEMKTASACVLPECAERCAKEDACGVLDPDDKDVCGLFCSTDIAALSLEQGSACADAGRAHVACVGGLECAELAEGSGCEAELAAFMAAC